MVRTTLRQLNDFDETPARLGHSTLIMIDFQNTYTKGVMELDGWQQAIDAAAKLLKHARDAGATVIHIINDGGTGTPYDVHAEIGQIHPKVAAVEGEAVVVKTAPNAFVGTNLDDLLNSAGHEDVIVVGFMTNMCVLFTAAGAFLQGKKPTIVANACATRPLHTKLAAVSSEQLHHSALATIADLYGVVVSSVDELR